MENNELLKALDKWEGIAFDNASAFLEYFFNYDAELLGINFGSEIVYVYLFLPEGPQIKESIPMKEWLEFIKDYE